MYGTVSGWEILDKENPEVDDQYTTCCEKLILYMQGLRLDFFLRAGSCLEGFLIRARAIFFFLETFLGSKSSAGTRLFLLSLGGLNQASEEAFSKIFFSD